MILLSSQALFATERETLHAGVIETPIITSKAYPIVMEGHKFFYRMKATDPDGGPLTYSYSASDTKGMNMTSKGVFTWSADRRQKSSPEITVTVTDDEGKTATETFTVYVSSTTHALLKKAIQRLMDTYGEAYLDGNDFLAELRQVDATPDALQAFARKAVVVNHPVLKNKGIVFVERYQYPTDHHNTATIFQIGEVNEFHRDGSDNYSKFKGSSLKRLDFKTDTVSTLFSAGPEGAVRDPEVHFDGEKIVYSYRPSRDGDWHIYEMNLCDLSIQQLTRLKGVSDIEPFYMSDGTIGFVSTRDTKFCTCNKHIQTNLYKMESDGSNVFKIGGCVESEQGASQMPDGRLLYFRWEYIDRNFGGANGLWTCNPDGTNHKLHMWQSTPQPIVNPRAIPGRPNEVIGVICDSHSRPWGALAIFDRSQGTEGVETIAYRDQKMMIWPLNGQYYVTDAENPKPGMERREFDRTIGAKARYEDPCPISADFFLATRTIDDPFENGAISDAKTAVFMLDVFGNEILVHQSPTGELGCYDSMVLAATEKPAIKPDRIDLQKNHGTFLISNVYEGTHMAGVAPGSIKTIRIVDNPPKTSFSGENPYSGDGFQVPAMNYHDYANKHVLGTVPVEADGSAHFQIPTGKFVLLQALDDKGKMVQSMRSGMMVQPGEVNACIGCHEDRNQAPVALAGVATTKPAYVISMETTADAKPFSYSERVQPIWDKHCIECHDYGGKGENTVNLSGDKTAMFSVSYLDLYNQKLISWIGGGVNRIYQAYEWGSSQSKLIDVLEAGHENVKLTREEVETILLWIDLNAPYYPDYAGAYPDSPGGRSPLTSDEINAIEKLTTMENITMFKYSTPVYFNFTRPEHSPVLKLLKRPENKAAVLALIQQGADRLEKTPRNDMPGFVPCAKDQRRLDRYDALVENEKANWDAIRKNTKRVDPVSIP